ncbi:MAG: serine hydrolase domain-containing protein [Stackebrandtia sp.]
MRSKRTTAVALGATAVTVALGAGVLVAAEAQSSGDVGESIDEFFAESLPEDASLSVVAGHAGDQVYCEGFGQSDRENGVAADCDTVYDIGSVTKQFTGAAVLKLEMDGELSVDDPVSKFFDSVPDDKRDITVHQLLTHTSGLVDQLGDDYDPIGRDELLEAAAESKLLWPPGTAHSYSNLGYSVLAAIVEEVSGLSYDEYLNEKLFAPAGMTQTGYTVPEFDQNKVAQQYDANDEPQGKPNELPWAEDGPYWNLRGNGGILSTAADMFAWQQALAGEDVLSAEAKEKLFEAHVPEEDDGDTYYGYGWVIFDAEGNKVAWHNGGNGFSFADALIDLDEGHFVFWNTNQVEKKGQWNLEELDVVSEVYRILREAG